VKTFISDLRQYWKDRPFIWSEFEDFFAKKVRLPTYGKVLVLGPHPDDPESVAITCRLLRYFGCDIWYAIASMSPSGVEDEYAQRWQNNGFISLQEKKMEIRRREQTWAAEMFGLAPDRLAFLGIEENKDLNSPEDLTRMKDHLESVVPDIVIMPIGKDLNQTHAWVYQAFRKCAKDLTLKTEKPIIALYNEDPKTIEIRKDLFVLFGEEGADWKRALLRVHDTQQQRNIHSRGMGFDERILRINHLSYRLLHETSPLAALSAKYAEVFEIELFDFPSLEANE
jgi:LmbE family N-acetylglucosaminyl deacetylase